MKVFSLSYFHVGERILVETVYLAGQAIPAIVLGTNWHDVTFVPVKLLPNSHKIWEVKQHAWIENVCAGTSERYRDLHIHDWHIEEIEGEEPSETAIVVCRDGYRYGAGIQWRMSAVFNDKLHEITANDRKEFYSNPAIQKWFELKKGTPHFDYATVKDYVDSFANPEVVGIPPMEIVGDSHAHLPLDSDLRYPTRRQIILKVRSGSQWAIASHTSIRSRLPEVSMYAFDGDKITEKVAAKSWHKPK